MPAAAKVSFQVRGAGSGFRKPDFGLEIIPQGRLCLLSCPGGLGAGVVAPLCVRGVRVSDHAAFRPCVAERGAAAAGTARVPHRSTLCGSPGRCAPSGSAPLTYSVLSVVVGRGRHQFSPQGA